MLRGTWEINYRALLTSRLQDYHFLWSLVPEQFSLISYSTRQNHLSDTYSHNPHVATRDCLHNISFWLFPFRSPLLRESLRFIFLALLRCFSSCRYPLCPMNSDKDARSLFWRVSPFGHPRINAWLAAPRGFQQPPTSFIAS